MDRLLERPRALFLAIAAACLLAPASASAVTIVKAKPLKFKTAGVNLATATVPFSQQLAVSGGTPPYTYSLQSGQLPEGLTLSPEGLISGTAEHSGFSMYTVEVRDSGEPAQTATMTYKQFVQLDVLPKKLSKTSAWNPAYTPLSAAGGSGSYSFSLVEGELPEGVELVRFGGGETVIDGDPFVAGTYAFTIEARDESTGYTGQRRYKWKIPLSMSPPSGEALPEAVVGHSYYATFDAMGGSDYHYEIIEGELPEGLSLEQEENSEAIKGTPGKAETQKITVLATDLENGLTAKAKYTIAVAPFAFPKGRDVLEEENLEGDELKGRDEIFFQLHREKAGVATGTMIDSDGSTGTWRLDVATGQLSFNWPEFEHTGGLAYEGHCNLQEERCSGASSEFAWSLTPSRPGT